MDEGRRIIELEQALRAAIDFLWAVPGPEVTAAELEELCVVAQYDPNSAAELERAFDATLREPVEGVAGVSPQKGARQKSRHER